MSSNLPMHKRWAFLCALKLGEVYIVDNPYAETETPSATRKYREVTAALLALHGQDANLRWVQRAKRDKIEITLVRNAEGQYELSVSGGNRRAVMPTGPDWKDPIAIQKRKILRQRFRRQERKKALATTKTGTESLPLQQKQERIKAEKTRVITAVRREQAQAHSSGVVLTEHLVKMIRAHATGNEIEHLRDTGFWELEPFPDFLDSPQFYRLKPKYHDFWLVMSRTKPTEYIVFLHKEMTAAYDQSLVIHTREVRSEDEDP